MKFPGPLLAALLCVAFATTSPAQSPAPPAPAVWAVEASDAAAQREDLSVYETQVFALDKAYSPEARKEAEERLAALKADIGKLSNGAFILRIGQIIALADNGHSAMIYRGDGFGRAGLRLGVFGDDFYVLRATAGHADILGGRLVSIDGIPLAALRETARSLVGGVPPWRDRQAATFLESPRQMHALGLIRGPDAATYLFETPQGRKVEAQLTTAPPPAGAAPGAEGVLDPVASPDWPTLLAPEKAPWGYRDFHQPHRWRDAPELDAVVIQLHDVFNAPDHKLIDVLQAAEAARTRAGRRNVVLDLRFNSGGDIYLMRDFLLGQQAALPADGRVVILISPWTFSAAITAMGYLKQTGGERVVLVGDGPGDRMRFFSEGRPVRLPHSGAFVAYATQRHDYLTGCKPFSDCYPLVVQHPIALKSLSAEVAAPLTIEAYVEGRDPGMEAAARVLGKAS